MLCPFDKLYTPARSSLEFFKGTNFFLLPVLTNYNIIQQRKTITLFTGNGLLTLADILRLLLTKRGSVHTGYRKRGKDME